VIFPWVWLAFRHAPSLTSSLNLVEVETLPSGQVVLSCPSLGLRPPVLWPPPTSHPASFRISPFGLYLLFRLFCATDRMRPLLFHRLLSQHPALPTPESSSRLLSRFFAASLPSPCVTGSALSCSPCGANMSVLQVSLYVTGCCFASLSQGVTTLRHNQSPSYIGCLLPGGLTLTRTGLSPASRR